jgi:hypothetical protein
MKKLVVSVSVAVVASFLTLLGAAAPAQAATCGALSGTTDGHSIWITCTAGAGNRYKLVGQFCSTSGCVWQGSNWTSYGHQAKVTSGGYFNNAYRIDTGTAS